MSYVCNANLYCNSKMQFSRYINVLLLAHRCHAVESQWSRILLLAVVNTRMLWAVISFLFKLEFVWITFVAHIIRISRRLYVCSYGLTRFKRLC
jgi:hypothetical protein